jgi:hypothetical protein
MVEILQVLYVEGSENLADAPAPFAPESGLRARLPIVRFEGERSIRRDQRFARRIATATAPAFPSLGTGLNIQAATLAGYKHKDVWNDLLVKVGRPSASKKDS